MDQLDPFMRFLGVEESSDPVTLLGLGDEPLTSASIEKALRRQLARVYGHPDGRGPAAERVKKTLRKVAEELRKPLERERAAAMPRNGSAGASVASAVRDRPDFSRPARPRLQLTEFDRQVIATLVSCGGWNAMSRSRLVGLAAAYNVSVDGLMRVLAGLSEYGRSGGGHIEVDEITQGAPTMVVPPPRRAPGEIARAAAKAAERVAPELREPSLWSTVKLSALFGLITIVVGVLFLRTLIGSDEAKPVGPAAVVVEPGPGTGTAPINAGAGRSQAAGTGDQNDGSGRLARFDAPPTFMGNALSPRITTATDESVELPAHFDDIERRVTVLSTDPPESLMQNWRVSLETIALSWPHAQSTVRAKVDEAILAVLHEASSRPSLVDRLLAELIPANVVIEPEDINIGAWRAGTLGRIAESRLPPAVTEQARRWVQQAVPNPPEGSMQPFVDHARAWLDAVAPDLIERAQYEPRFEDFWETWLTAQSALTAQSVRSDHRAFDRSILAVIEHILASGADLANPGPAVNLVARLLSQLHYDMNPEVRDTMLSWFDMEGISIDDLWVLTSILAMYNRHTAGWFKPDLVLVERNPLQPGAYKRRFRDRIRSAWPKVGSPEEASIRAAGTGLPVDPAVASQWRDALKAMLALPRTDDEEELIRRLEVAADLNTAAALLASGDPVPSQVLIEEILSLLAPPQSDADGGGRPPTSTGRQQIVTWNRRGAQPQQSNIRPGQPIGPDGAWAASFEAARSTEEKIALLEQLQQGAATDLGPIDAAKFVEQVYRGQPAEVREQAQMVLLGNFTTGPEVAMHMLDHFPGTAGGRAISDLIEQYTNITLPEQRNRAWQIAARRGLAEHALRLHPERSASLDEATDSLAASYDEQLLALTDGGQLLVSTGRPGDAIARVLAEFQERARILVPTEEVPDSLVGLTRRHQIRLRLAEGTIQRFVAHQLAVTDVLAYITVAEQPALADVVRDLLARSARERLTHRHVLQQALRAELLASELWDMRMAGEGMALHWRAKPETPEGRSLFAEIRAIAMMTTTSVGMRIRRAPMRATDWDNRLEQLDPAQPMAYFELAEEVADLADDPEDESLARRLFALAGLLDPEHLARSACLALADLEADALAKRRLLALAALLDPDATTVLARIGGAGRELHKPDAIIAVVDAISSYRQGYGSRAQTDLRTEGAEALLNSLDDVLPGGVDRFREEIRLYRNGQPPQVYEGRNIALLHIQLGLLAGEQRRWESDLLLERGRPLIEVDPNDLEATFGHDTSRPIYRDGRWVALR